MRKGIVGVRRLTSWSGGETDLTEENIWHANVPVQTVWYQQICGMEFVSL